MELIFLGVLVMVMPTYGRYINFPFYSIKRSFHFGMTSFLQYYYIIFVLIYQVKRPESAPAILKGHDGEVTAVDWYVKT